MTIKRKLLVIILLSLWHGMGQAEPQMNDEMVLLYSLGYELGEDMKQEQLELNQKIIMQGIKDALEGKKHVFGADVQRQAIASLRKQRAERNLRKAEAFLAENKNKPGVKTLPSGLQYKVMTTGEGKIPSGEDTVTVAFRASLLDGTEFASSVSLGKPAKFQVNKIISGLSEALKLMPTGSRWELYMHPDLAYGTRSPGNKVPPNSGLIYEIELLSVE